MNQFLGQITLFACDFAPVGWALCQGQVLPVSQNAALFSLLGTYYGGNGTTTFALPDLRGRLPKGKGAGIGLTNYDLGETGGWETVVLSAAEMPAHNHPFLAYTTQGNTADPAGALPAQGDATGQHGHGTVMNIYHSGTTDVVLNPQQITPHQSGGGGQSHSNIQPVLALNWCISLTGVFPSRP